MKKNYIDQQLLENISAEQKKNKEPKGKSILGFNTNLKNYSDALDEYYILNKLRIISTHLNNINTASSSDQPYQMKDFLFSKAIINLIQKKSFENPSIQLFIEIIKLQQLIKQKKSVISIADFGIIENHLKAFANEIESRDKITAYLFIANLSIRQLNKGKFVFQEKLFLAHNESLNIRYGQLKSKEKMSATFYRNIYLAAIGIADHPLFKSLKTYGLKTYKEETGNGMVWAEKFLNFYKRHLNKKDQITYRYCLAMLAFQQQQFEKAFLALGNTKGVRGLYINLNVKRLY